MKRIWRAFKARWTLAAIVAAGLLALVYLSPNAFKDVSQKLIALFGLMMAGVLPTMVLTASALRAGNLSVNKLISYRDALRRQMVLWIGLFLIALTSSLLVVVGKMSGWSIVIPIHLNWLPFGDLSFDAIRLVNAAIAMALSVVVLRVISVGNGIFGLLGLSAELAISEAQAREDERHQAAEAAIKGMSEREGFGPYVDLEH